MFDIKAWPSPLNVHQTQSPKVETTQTTRIKSIDMHFNKFLGTVAALSAVVGALPLNEGESSRYC